ncbi:pyocin knob domain-containing protein [Vreelandella aquamarina]
MSAEQLLAENNVKISNLIDEVTIFRDAAMGLNDIYPTVTEGRQAVADGKYFSVPGDGAYMRLYRRQGSSASLISEFPSRDELNSVIDQLGPLFGREVVGGAGGLMAEGAFGLGNDGVSITDWNDTPSANCFLSGTSSSALNKPPGGATNGYQLVRNDNNGVSIYKRQFASGINGSSTYSRVFEEGAWTDWERELNTTDMTQGSVDARVGKLIKTGDYGLGVVDLNNNSRITDDVNLVRPSGMYYQFSGALNKLGGANCQHLEFPEPVEGYTAQLAIAQSSSPRIGYRTKNNNAFTDWIHVYDTKSAIGPVSVEAGNPTGAIIERGSNANGEYIKFADGTLICWGDIVLTIPANSGSSEAWTTPIVFSGIRRFSVSPNSSTPQFFDVSVGSGGMVYAHNKSNSSQTVTVYITGFGRWY